MKIQYKLITVNGYMTEESILVDGQEITNTGYCCEFGDTTINVDLEDIFDLMKKIAESKEIIEFEKVVL